MARFNGGYIKLWRSLHESDIGQNGYLLAVWVSLLMMATWKESKVLRKGKQVCLPPGTVVFGLREMAQHLGFSISTISKWVHYLHDTGRIVNTSDRAGSIATICNWKEKQDENIDAGSIVNTSRTRRSTQREHDAVHNAKRSEEGNKERSNTTTTKPARGSPSASPFAGVLEKEIYAAYPRKLGKQKGLLSFGKVVKTKEDLEAVRLALSRFLAHHAAARTEPQFIPHFSTWANSWRDWLDADAGKVQQHSDQVDSRTFDAEWPAWDKGG